MNMFTMLWAASALIFIVLELGHPSLLFYLPHSIACLSAACAAYFQWLFIHQMTLFFWTFAASVWIFKSLLKQMHGPYYRTNGDALVGKTARVTAAISPDDPGYVKVQGELWLARCHTYVPVSAQVRIIGVRGAHVIVEPHNVH